MNAAAGVSSTHELGRCLLPWGLGRVVGAGTLATPPRAVKGGQLTHCDGMRAPRRDEDVQRAALVGRVDAVRPQPPPLVGMPLDSRAPITRPVEGEIRRQ